MMRVPEFRLFTSHGNTLLLVARDPRIRIKEIASLLDMTEREAQRVVADLAKSGYLDREKDGRRNVYRVKTDLPLHLPGQRDVDIKTLLKLLAESDTPTAHL